MIPPSEILYPQPISLYGDSFIYGSEVDHDAAWGNQFSIELGGRVANLGVAAYGTDQAYLRFRDNTDDRAEVVILGIYPQNVLRNVNQYRFLLASDEPLSFKPRFILEDGRPHHIPIPTIPVDEVPRFVDAPEKCNGHLNPRGNRILAEIIRDYLQSENLLVNKEESEAGESGQSFR